jgi:hypothetical protein
MRRVLFLSALMSLGGCWCFDAKYMDFCRNTGRCDGGESDGTPVALALDELPHSLVGSCLQATLRFQDREGRPAAFSAQQTLMLSSPTEDLIFFDDCSQRTVITELPVAPRTLDISFAVLPNRFGRTVVIAKTSDLPGVSRSFIATGQVKFRKAGYAVPLDGGCVPLEVIVESSRTPGIELSPALPTQAVFSLQPGQFRFGADMMCTTTSGPLIPIPFINTQATVWVGNSGASAVGDQGVLLVDGSKDAGVVGPYTANIFAECIPAFSPCSDSADCCSGNCTAAQGCAP